MESFNKRHQHPKDSYKYLVAAGVIEHTEFILLEYANLHPSNEGFVYWAGIKNNESILVNMVIAPKAVSGPLRIEISPTANVDFIKELAKHDLIQIGQVHSHPEDWVDHSLGDDRLAAFKVEGLLSIVVPNYCNEGMLPLSKCGVHRYDNGEFMRLDERYIQSHFEITKKEKGGLIDLR